MLNISIFDIIVNKLYFYQKFYIVVLFEIDKNLELYLYYTIFFFYLVVNLKIKDNKNLLFNKKEVV